jgi:glycosyltransferase involved in cell wall biosynthesis
MRVLHCPTNVGGNPWALSRAERKLGLLSDVMVFVNDKWYASPVDYDLNLSREHLARSVVSLSAFFIKALFKYDVFHFSFGSSFTPFGITPRPLELMDLPLLKSLGKKIIVTYQGCDVRQKSFCINNFAVSACAEADCYGGYCNDEIDTDRKRRATRFGHYAHKIFSLNPDLLRVLPAGAEFMPYASVDLSNWVPSEGKRTADKKLTILHAPSGRGVKGTRYVIEAIEKLKQTFDIEFLLVENVPHEKVREMYAKADLAVDQLLCGWYGGFAVEMMALGKPVVCYLREEDLDFLPADMKKELPVINAKPDSIYEVLLKTINERDSLPEIGVKSRAFVEKWHDTIKIARRLKEVYEAPSH